MIETFVNMEWIRKALLIIGSLLLILTINPVRLNSGVSGVPTRTVRPRPNRR